MTECNHLARCKFCINDMQIATQLGRESENKRVLDEVIGTLDNEIRAINRIPYRKVGAFGIRRNLLITLKEKFTSLCLKEDEKK